MMADEIDDIIDINDVIARLREAYLNIGPGADLLSLAALEDQYFQHWQSKPRGDRDDTSKRLAKIADSYTSIRQRRTLYRALPWSAPIWDAIRSGDIGVSAAVQFLSRVRRKIGNDTGELPTALEVTKELNKYYSRTTKAVSRNGAVIRVKKTAPKEEKTDGFGAKIVIKRIRSQIEGYVSESLEGLGVPEESIEELLDKTYAEIQVVLDVMRNKIHYLKYRAKEPTAKLSPSEVRVACEVLGVSYSGVLSGSVTLSAVKKVHRRLAGQMHPDRTQDHSEASVSQYHQINDSMLVLERAIEERDTNG